MVLRHADDLCAEAAVGAKEDADSLLFIESQLLQVLRGHPHFLLEFTFEPGLILPTVCSLTPSRPSLATRSLWDLCRLLPGTRRGSTTEKSPLLMDSTSFSVAKAKTPEFAA